MNSLLTEIRKCEVCLPHLLHGVNPVLAAHKNSKIAIIGQAPGTVVHKSGVPWEDRSGDRLREWLEVEKSTFYDPCYFALIPMGFCYPGKSSSGDLPPRSECAPLWHQRLFEQMNKLKLVVLIGAYAQQYYLQGKQKRNLTETVKSYSDYLPEFFVLPHPSPRNNIWIKKNPWFTDDLLPVFGQVVRRALGNTS